jgi:ketopantoate reductase
MVVTVKKSFDVPEVAQLGRYCRATLNVHVFQEVIKGEDTLLAKIELQKIEQAITHILCVSNDEKDEVHLFRPRMKQAAMSIWNGS